MPKQLTSTKIIPFERSGELLYRKARRLIENNNFLDGLSFCRKASELEPENVEYKLALAEAYTEMCHYEESNSILFELLQHDRSPLTECYFGIGCNFMGLQEFDKAGESFNKYLRLDPEGDYSEEAMDFLEFLEASELGFLGFTLYDRKREKQNELAKKGKRYLDCGQYKKAIKVFEKILDSDDNLYFVANNLSLAYYCDKQIDKAIEICETLLKRMPDNIHANCNLAMFMNDRGDHERVAELVDKISSLNCRAADEINKVALTYCELNMDELANKAFNKLIQYWPYDKKAMHLLAISCYNLKNYREALILWKKILKLEPCNAIANYYLKLVKDGKDDIGPLPYSYQVPYDELLRRVKKLQEYLSMEKDSLKLSWEHDKEFESLIQWGIELNDSLIKKTAISLLAGIGGKKAESIMRRFIIDRNQPDEIKRDVFTMLKRMNAKEPYIAYIKDGIAEVRVSLFKDKDETLVKDCKLVLELTLRKMRGRYDKKITTNAIELWEYIMEEVCRHYSSLKKIEAWAAALEYVTCCKNGVHVYKSDLCKVYKTTNYSMNSRVASIRDMIEMSAENEKDN